MARKKNPIVDVLHFFEASSIEVAQTALSLVKDIVKRRTPAPAKTRKRAPKATTPVPGPTVVPPPVGKGNPPPLKRRKKPLEPADLALPGIGPSTVGD